MHFLYEDSPREVILESALHIGAAQGDEAITVESVAKLAEVTPAEVRAEFSDREQIVAAIPGYASERKVKFLEETLDAAPGYADLFTKLTTFTEAYYEYAEREPELFRYLFEQKGCVFEDEWQSLLQGNRSGNHALDLIYDNIALIAVDAQLEIGPDVRPQTLAKLSVASWATVHGMAHLSILGVLRHQHSVVRRFNLREVCKALIGTLFMAAETLELPDLRHPMQEYRALLSGFTPDRDLSLDITAIEELTELPAEQARAAVVERAIQLAAWVGMQSVTIENVAEYFGEQPEWWSPRLGDLGDVTAEDLGGPVDRVILDMLEPWEHLETVRDLLIPGGVFMTYVATVPQLMKVMEGIRELKCFTEPKAWESLVREWKVEGLATRPEHRMNAHTAFLIWTRRLADGVTPPRPQRRARK